MSDDQKRESEGHSLPLLVGRIWAKVVKHRHRWTRQNRMSEESPYFIYAVRKCRCGRTEIRNPASGEWVEVDQAQFSALPCFEKHHRDLFDRSVLLSSNVKAQGMARGPKPQNAQETQDHE